MAHAIMFDTLYYANKLKAAGISSEQAEVQAETLAEIIEEVEQHIATKNDLERGLQSLHTEISNAKNELYAEISNAKNELYTEISNVRNELHSEITNVKIEVTHLRSDMNVKFAEVYKAIAENKNELIKWGMGISFGQAALIISVLKLLH